jgi:hypothetical protein
MPSFESKEFEIIRISTRIFPDLGGPAKHVYKLSQYASSNKLKITNIACSPPNNTLKKKEINKNFQIIYLPLKAPNIENSSILNELVFSLKFILYSVLEILKFKQKK